MVYISPDDDPDWIRRQINCQYGAPQIVLNRLHGRLLRKHNGRIIGIWPNAVEYARRNRLHGLFASTFFFNAKDAEDYGEMTLNMYIDAGNDHLYRTLTNLLAHHVPLYRIPEKLEQAYHQNPTACERNFKSFFCL